MSTEWGLYCLDCKEETDTGEMYGTWGEDSLIDLVKIWPLVRDLTKASIHWEVSTSTGGMGHQYIAFLHSHDGHKIVVRDEYGRKSQISEASKEETCQQEKENN